MATLAMKESQEFAVFQLFAESKDYAEVLDKLSKYNKQHPDTPLFKSSQDKKALRDSYRIFDEAKRIVERNGKADFDNPQVIDTVTTIIEQKLPKVSQKRLIQEPQGITGKKINIGYMMKLNAENLKQYGKETLYGKEDSGHKTEQVMVGSYRPLNRGAGRGRVWGGSPEYKTTSQILRERSVRGG